MSASPVVRHKERFEAVIQDNAAIRDGAVHSDMVDNRGSGRLKDTRDIATMRHNAVI